MTSLRLTHSCRPEKDDRLKRKTWRYPSESRLRRRGVSTGATQTYAKFAFVEVRITRGQRIVAAHTTN